MFSLHSVHDALFIPTQILAHCYFLDVPGSQLIPKEASGKDDPLYPEEVVLGQNVYTCCFPVDITIINNPWITRLHLHPVQLTL